MRSFSVVLVLGLVALVPAVALVPGVALAGDCRPAPSAEDLALAPDAALGRAKALVDAGKFEEAASLYRAVALANPSTDAGRAAVRGSLEALALGGGSPNPVNPECFVRMGEDVAEYDRLICAPERDPHAAAKPVAELCRSVLGIERDIERLRAEHLYEAGNEKGGEEAREAYARAAEVYESIWTRFGPKLCAYADDGCARFDEVLTNAALAYHAARDYPSARRVRAVLLDPKNKLDASDLGVRAILDQGREWQSLGEYAEAAESYETFAKRAPKHERAAEALTDAVVLRLALGQMERARADAEVIEAMHGSERLAAGVILGILVTHADRDTAAVTEAYAAKKDAFFHEHADAMQIAQFDGVRAKGLVALGKTTAAEKLYAPLARIGTGGEIEKWVKAIDPDSPEGMRKLGRALTAVGEARLYLGSVAADKAIAMAITKGDVASYKAKRAAVEAAERELAKVLEVQPAPSPSTVVAAGVKVARMHAQLWGATYLALGGDAGKIEEDRATAANRTCLSYSAKWQYWVPGVERCASWVADHDPLYALDPGLPPMPPTPMTLPPSQPWFVDRKNAAVSAPGA